MKNERLLFKPLCFLALAASLLGGLALASQAGKAHDNADKELNLTYQKALAVITDPKDKGLLVEEQRSWIKYRDAKVAFHARYYPGSKGGLFVATDMTEERTKELKILLTEESMQEHKD